MVKSRFVYVVMATMLLAACAAQGAETARNAKDQMVGLSKEKVLACMNRPGFAGGCFV